MPPEPAEDSDLKRAEQVIAGAAHAATVHFANNLLVAAALRGYIAPDEDEEIKLRYTQYLSVRTALLSLLGTMEPASGRNAAEWRSGLPRFSAAFAAACLLLRGALGLVDQAKGSRLLRKKLDEADSLRGIPRKTFTAIYRSCTDTSRLHRFRDAADFYYAHRREIHATAPAGILAALTDCEPWIDACRSGISRRRLGYRWFSFRRRHHSAWKKSIFGFFELSGRAIADLRQPGVKASGAAKRVSIPLRERALALARPGDIFVTRHDDALSNLFLPGHWPHAALYLGSPEQRRQLGLVLPPPLERRLAGEVCFLEAKKDGVLLRPPDDTLAVDAFVILRSPLGPPDLATVLTRAMDHAGKPFDFSFDFRRAERLACTELVYRAYHHCGPVVFSLIEVSARPCLPAEELISQSLAQGFRVVAACGVGNDEIISGPRAELLLHASRSAL
ncbi:YiiX/YebB-like N1pC/P60 family cysteine hydrolase [Luteolibacter sp. GHJ8]|uniref:YiiX/YebB-like N1pC/P60 family cysteine hydrolase n=1 Tax=Luteolibacter rhizosphaerae TaxID=2989719 RepID=A0ABT3G0X9_9BACT|nr:YiiX/YebB-like N1pC/P60 family cysteine hydrolase [Luteolibacter rhizosphaerae]MCW1913322.1 YiiX/YebB-like N1pC/P60 family cysteine hydrolase [Luteolibacter rhizosphaerae]